MFGITILLFTFNVHALVQENATAESKCPKVFKGKVSKIEDFEALSKHLNEFQKKSYSQFKDHKDDNKIKKSLKNILKRIDAYV